MSEAAPCELTADKSNCRGDNPFHNGPVPEELSVLDFKVRQGEALHRQITKHIRALIYAGKLATGEKLPRMYDLARQWNTNYFTVHTALTGLVEEGLLERKPRLGTFVRTQEQDLRSVGIYYGDEILAKPERAFYRSLHSQLLTLLQKEKIANRVFVDCRPQNLQLEPLKELTDAIQSKMIQGLIVPLITPAVTDWVGKLSLPTSLFSSARTEYSRICVDNYQIMVMACQTLRERGCQTVGLINPIPPTAAGGGKTEDDSIHNAFLACAKTFNLKTRASWIRVPEKMQFMQEKYGYQEVHKIWALSERPDGLIVCPENVSRGAVVAALELGIKTPSELKLVLHTNQNVEFLCPLPVDWVVTRERDIAKALIQQIKDRFLGLKPRNYEIHHQLVRADEVRPASLRDPGWEKPR